MCEASDTAKFRDKHANRILPNLWSNVSDWIHTLEDKYADLISEDLEWTSRMEGIVRAGSYIMTLGQSEFISELVYSISNAMVLFNDSIILSVLRRKSKQNFLKKILFKTLAILETFQVSIEMITKRYLGERLRWTVITIISLLKSLSRALLVFYLRAGVSHCQVVQPLDRQLFVNKHQVEREVGDGPAVTSAGKAWMGNRTNKVIRSVQDDVNRPYEELKESHLHIRDPMGPDEVPWSILTQNQLLAEGISIVKPIAHLLSMAAFGETSIKSWFIPLTMDIISLYLMESGGTNFRKRELQELTKRKFNFIFYIMRSPVYDKYFKSKLMSILGYLANRIPLFGRLIEQFIHYIPTWQTTYFYVWAS
ncbi:hypothetical protein LOD99_7568 [Oopsacas minuta]|uniref:Peroxisomal membrane protein PEX16 n=1 Tax=Oopsacas minuta TaxID=111878 RepID=A0AAV7JNU5_9METZ|nr:hypothetical protein LOD99_7568 [Oopsacas minuta]